MEIPRWVVAIVVILHIAWLYNDAAGMGDFYGTLVEGFITFVKSVGN